jgi:hypothetical protein
MSKNFAQNMSKSNIKGDIIKIELDVCFIRRINYVIDLFLKKCSSQSDIRAENSFVLYSMNYFPCFYFLAAGAAYAFKRAGKKLCVICYFGEGAASEGANQRLG